MWRFLAAIRFLTIVPVPGRDVPPGAAALFFPLVGGVLGAAGGLLLIAARALWPEPLPALLVVLFWVAVTGALHEDGLADVADAFRSYRSREKILAILKDSRIGAFGAAAVIFSILLRWQALAAISEGVVEGLAGALALSRAAAVLLSAITPGAGQGLGAALRQSLAAPVVAGVLAQAAPAMWLCGWPAAALLAVSLAGILAAARSYFIRRIGGVTGDCLGAVSQTVEAAALLILACRNCM